MSRAHMLYDNKALTTLPVKTTVWKGGWEEGVIFKKNGYDVVSFCRNRYGTRFIIRMYSIRIFQIKLDKKLRIS